ncbi:MULTISPECIES: fibrinogen-like YCDxxxxGGGW domain-containing protein [Pseudoalteromonas]|uniref:Uncharacterized protein n=1 Tax=Pseudoalteromonas amylolytica TaxID=1859457 RepID=A0A1S1MPW7_9GAMM|nr:MULTISPECIES: fibrinogen-like YCDxxxxGGGW domain-containing protein [Pseudoalteromonas]OHU84402.1 hypothetical protein BFC16_01820 [Pseudoalteromonas sp. JW3]OHU87058.1 hypothetical protein BET10_00115 [Pseudoalteromonas amylolytica]
MNKSIIAALIGSALTFSANAQQVNLNEDAVLDSNLEAVHQRTSLNVSFSENNFSAQTDEITLTGSFIENDAIVQFHKEENGGNTYYLGKKLTNTLYQGTWYNSAQESGDFQLDLAASNTPTLRSCFDVVTYDQTAASGVYIIEANDTPTKPVYCNMDIAQGGWTLVDTRARYGLNTHTSVTELTDPMIQTNHYLASDIWQYLKMGATQMMVTDGINDNYAIFDLSLLESANCQALTDDLSTGTVFHSESDSCTFGGADYTYLSHPTNSYLFSAMYIYNMDFLPIERSGRYGTTSSTNKIYYAAPKIQIFVR